MKLVNYFTTTVFTLLVKIICLLITIAYYTLAERKIMASVQRRLGPNVVGFWGLLQPLADGLKLFGKELVIPTHANSRIFLFAPMGVLGCAFLVWAIVPFYLFDHSVGMDASLIRDCLLADYTQEKLEVFTYEQSQQLLELLLERYASDKRGDDRLIEQLLAAAAR